MTPAQDPEGNRRQGRSAAASGSPSGRGRRNEGVPADREAIRGVRPSAPPEARVPMSLVGRDEECQAIDRLLADAAAMRSGNPTSNRPFDPKTPDPQSPRHQPGGAGSDLWRVT
jgi:hypothetical protein